MTNNSVLTKRHKSKKCKRSSKYSRKKKYYGGNILDIQNDIQNNLTNLGKLREYSKICADSIIVKNYIKDTLGLFIDLLQNYYKIGTIQEKYKDLTKSEKKINDYGYVNVENFNQILTDGNLREQMSMMLILCECFMDIFIKLLMNKLNSLPKIKNVNNDSLLLNLIQTKLIGYLGFNDINQLIDYYNKCNNNCIYDYTMISISESNVPARYSGFPMKPTRIARQETTNDLYILNSNILHPPLSCYEKLFLSDRQQKIIKNSVSSDLNNNSCPNINNIDQLIKSGANYYSIDENSSFYKLCLNYNHYMVAGPSGATDILFHVFGIFDNFNIELFIMSCIAYMGNTPDHSIFEILIPTISYGSEYNSTIDEYVFVDKILQKNNIIK
jgi:hypothetical protein